MKRVPTLTTTAAAAYGSHRYCGFALEELVGEGFLGLTALAANRRRLSPNERALLDEFAAVVAAADPRIWPLKITRIVASYGSVPAGFAAGQLPIEGDTIGPWTTMAAAHVLLEVRSSAAHLADESAFERAVLEIARRRGRLVGYGVPLRRHDERLAMLRACIERHGRTTLPYWALQERLSACLRRARKLEPNIAIGSAAMLLDLGFDPLQAASVATFANENTFAVNAIEGAEQRAEDLRRLPDDCVAYAGPAPRESPRSASRGRQ